MHPKFAPSPVRESKTLSWKSVYMRIFIALTLAMLVDQSFAALLDSRLTTCRKGEHGAINNAIEAQPEIIILGSSRADHHFDDRRLTAAWGVRTFNAGVEGMGIPYSRVIQEQIFTKVHPKLVIVDVIQFEEDMDCLHLLDPWYPRSRVLKGLLANTTELKANGTANGPSEDWGNRLLMASGTYRFAGKSLEILKGARLPADPFGFHPLANDHHHHPGLKKKPKTMPWLIPQLDSLVQEARAAGCQVILIFSPVYLTGFRYGQEYCDVVINPTREYADQKGLPFFVFDIKNHPELADETLYFDETHLNARGATIFTDLVAKKLRPFLPKAVETPEKQVGK